MNFRNNLIFYGEELLAPRSTPKLDDHPLSAVGDCLFNIFAATLFVIPFYFLLLPLFIIPFLVTLMY
jgi:hypothetical protein